MNSFILSSIAAFCHSFANAFRKSGLCKLLMKIYNGISGSWKNSSVMTWIRIIGQIESNSVAVRIVRCPFTFLTFIKKKIGKFVFHDRLRIKIIYINYIDPENALFLLFILCLRPCP